MRFCGTYKEWRDSPQKWNQMAYGWWIVSTDRGHCYILQWEPSNAKWYAPSLFSGRQEAGYTNELWIRDEEDNEKIVHIRMP